MKKLLILGGNRLSCDIVRAAKAEGIYTIVTDWNDPQKSPAKIIADEYWNDSLMDYDKLCAKISRTGINGIITGFTDSNLLPYQHLCEVNSFPCYATKDQFAWTLDKASFKKKCIKYGVPVVPEYELEKFDPLQINKENRIIIKPVDNSGSRGICICDNPKDFQEKLKYSLEFSKKKLVVIERYMDCDDVSFEYTIQDGEVMLSAICDRYIYKTLDAGSVTSKLIYPSKYLPIYIAETDEKVKRMFQEEGLQNGVLFMQVFVENGSFYFYEMGYRLSGGRHYVFAEKENNRSSVKELIHFATTGHMADFRLSKLINPAFQDVCCMISILCRSEKIYSIEGLDNLNEIAEIVNFTQHFSIGDTIGKEGTTAQIFARLHIVTKDEQRLSLLLHMLKNRIFVRNEDGENMIIWDTP